MKTLLLITSILLLFAESNAQSDNSIQKDINIKFNGLSIFRESIEGSIEKSINDKNTFEIAIGSSSWSNKTTESIFDSLSQSLKTFQNTVESFKFYNLRIQWSHYLISNKNTFSGLYIGPYLKISGGTASYSFTTESTVPYFGKDNNINLEANLMSIAAGGTLGYQVNI